MIEGAFLSGAGRKRHFQTKQQPVRLLFSNRKVRGEYLVVYRLDKNGLRRTSLLYRQERTGQISYTTTSENNISDKMSKHCICSIKNMFMS